MRIVMLLLLAAAVSGCNLLPGGGGSPDQPVDVEPVEPPGSDPIHDPDGDPSLRVEPDPRLVEPRPAEIDHFRIGPDGRTLLIYWWGGTPSCFGLKQIELEMRDGRPSIGLVAGTLPEAVGKPCTMELVLKSTSVVLPAPILLDGSGNTHPPGEPMLPTQPMLVEPRDDVREARPHALTGYRLSADGLELEVHYVGGVVECYGLAGVEVEPTGRALTVTVREGAVPGGPQACQDIGLSKVVLVTLQEPLIEAA